MPKLATKLRQSTGRYSKLDSERSSAGDEKGKTTRDDGDREILDETPYLPRCSTSTWPRAPRRRNFSTFSASETSKDKQEEEDECIGEPSTQNALLSRHSRSSKVKLLPKIRQTLAQPFRDIKSRVHDLQVQTRRKCRRLRLHANSFLGRTMEVALGPWQAVQGCLYGLLLVCLGVAEILLSIVFTILYKTLEVVIKTLLIPVLIIVALANALRCQ